MNIRRPIKHGTPGGYMAHRRRDETPCAACLRAWRIYYRERNDALPRSVIMDRAAAAKHKRDVLRAQMDRKNAARLAVQKELGRRTRNPGAYANGRYVPRMNRSSTQEEDRGTQDQTE